MGDFHKAFYAIDVNGSGAITVEELQNYMMKNNYKPTFVTKWLNLFDVDNSGIITYKHYCETLGLVPKPRESNVKEGVKLSVESIAPIEICTNGKPLNEKMKNNMPIELPRETVTEIQSVKLSSNEIEEDSTYVIIPKNYNENNQEPLVMTNKVKQSETAIANIKQKNETQKSDKSNKDDIFNTKISPSSKRDRKEAAILTVDVTQPKQMKQTRNLHFSDPNILTASEVITTVNAIMDTVVENKDSNKAAALKTFEQPKGRTPQSYPIQVVKKGRKHRGKLFSQHKRRLRGSIKPGVILILLTGRHKGKRVVFLSQLGSGLLLVTGPFKINGCPLRRVHQQMVIATKTMIDVSDVCVPDHINDAYFTGDSHRKNNSSADVSSIFTKTEHQHVVKEERKTDQKEVDKQVMTAIKSREDRNIMVKYLKSLFSLSSHDCPHTMKF